MLIQLLSLHIDYIVNRTLKFIYIHSITTNSSDLNGGHTMRRLSARADNFVITVRWKGLCNCDLFHKLNNVTYNSFYNNYQKSRN